MKEGQRNLNTFLWALNGVLAFLARPIAIIGNLVNGL